MIFLLGVYFFIPSLKVKLDLSKLKYDDRLLINDFIELYEARLAQECEIYYKKGFRFAYRLMIECFNDNF